MGEEKELKVGMLTKRAQQKKSISRTNYKERVFVLTQTHLAYHEGSVQVSKVYYLIHTTMICDFDEYYFINEQY